MRTQEDGGGGRMRRRRTPEGAGGRPQVGAVPAEALRDVIEHEFGDEAYGEADPYHGGVVHIQDRKPKHRVPAKHGKEEA